MVKTPQQSKWVKWALSPAVGRDIVLSINIQCNICHLYPSHTTGSIAYMHWHPKVEYNRIETFILRKIDTTSSNALKIEKGKSRDVLG